MEFTNEEFEATDPFYQQFKDKMGDDTAYLVMKDIAFAVDHSHDNDSVLLTQRFSHSVVNEDGFTEEKPHQVSIVIPSDQLEGLIMHLIASGMCLTVAKKEGKVSHDEAE